jgi:hypothetical protein
MMDQFLSRLLDKYGLARMIIAVLFGFVILWALAHFSAAPGGNVSVLFGVVEYTKSKPDTPTTKRSTAAPETTRQERALSLYEESLKAPASTTILADPKVLHGITAQNVDQTLQTLRSQRHLRSLEALESGRSVAETPRGTYFFISTFYLATSAGGMAKKLGSQNVSRFRETNSYMEIHLLSSGVPIVVGFASETDALRIDSPTTDIGKVSICAVPWEKMTSLVSLFTDRVAKANDRVLNLAERDRLVILDCELQ